jgi:hypothetical protein
MSTVCVHIRLKHQAGTDFLSFAGVVPKQRLYSLLNCDELS